MSLPSSVRYLSFEISPHLGYFNGSLTDFVMKSFCIFLKFYLLGIGFCLGIILRGNGRNGGLGEPATEIEELPGEKYFDQKLDHFNPSNTMTWKQRYFVNDTFYRTGGPIFLLIGGEGEASPAWMVEGAWIDYAKTYNAFCIQVEHRFYGKSHPTSDLSTKNLAYLSSEQALADLAWFITSFNKTKDSTSKQIKTPPLKWIVFGGSYPGSLAAWMRLKYPHLVHGAVSSSGPLLALPDFKEYFHVVRASLASYHVDCVTTIEKGTKQLLQFIEHPLGAESIYKLFNLCDPLDTGNEDDVANLFESLASNFAEVVQYNKCNRHTTKKPKVNIDSVCDILLDQSVGSEIKRLAKVNDLMLSTNEEPCLDYKYEKMIKNMTQTGWDSYAASGMRQWTYQTCSEFGFFQTSNLNSTIMMFGNKFPVEFFAKQCKDIYGAKFDLDFVKEATRMTNTAYGGLNGQAVNVVYVHGSIDPWHALGVTKTLLQGAPAIYIEGTAHCANMYPKSPYDLPQLIVARKKIQKLIGEWLSQ